MREMTQKSFENQSEDNWDLIVIGGGPAGLTAGIYGARSGLKTLILEMMLPGGCIANAALVENYPGFPEGIPGSDLAKRLKDQCEYAGAEIHVMEKSLEVNLQGEKKRVITDNRKYCGAAVIIATGTQQRHLGIPSEKKFQGRGISYCAVCDGPFFKNKNVVVVGGGNSAAIDALFLSGLAKNVKLIHRRSTLRAENALVEDMMSNRIKILYNTEIKEFKGENKLRSILINNKDKDEVREIETDGVFIQIGKLPNSAVAKKSGIKLDERGYIGVDSNQRTNIDGVFAVGDVSVSPYKQMGTAIGTAIIAASEAYGYIKRPYYYKK